MGSPQAGPLDRLLDLGADALTDAELVSVVLRLRRGDKARELLKATGGVDRLLKSQAETLRRHGLSPTAVATLAAARQLVERSLLADIRRRPLLRPATVVRYLVSRYGTPDQEILGVLFLDPSQRLISEQVLYRGTLSRATVEPRQILRAAVHHQATGVLAWHSHPSGNTEPSDEDMMFTQRLESACELIGVRLLDHLIVGESCTWRSVMR